MIQPLSDDDRAKQSFQFCCLAAKLWFVGEAVNEIVNQITSLTVDMEDMARSALIDVLLAVVSHLEVTFVDPPGPSFTINFAFLGEDPFFLPFHTACKELFVEALNATAMLLISPPEVRSPRAMVEEWLAAVGAARQLEARPHFLPSLSILGMPPWWEAPWGGVARLLFPPSLL